MKLALILIGLLTLPTAHADITGTVTIKGPPNSKDETFIAAAAGCGESPVRHTENWKIGPKGELADVVVWIIDPKIDPKLPATAHTPPPKIAVRQIGCRYVPHIIAVQAGVPFAIINGDRTLHNVHAKVYDGPGKPPGADVFNFGEANQGQSEDRKFDQPGIFTLQCDVHAWMQCWVRVLPHPFFAVTDVDGTFKISPAAQMADGDYKIEAWHPRFLQPLEQAVHVQKGVAVVNFQFDGAKSF